MTTVSCAAELSLRDIARDVMLPPVIDAEIAELVGVIIGDGHLHSSRRGTKTDYFLSIAFNRTEDRPHIDWLMGMFGKKFGLTPTLRLRDHSNELLVRSKGITAYFNRIGVPVGKKAAIVSIPNQIVENKENLIACIRGIFDTDFSLTFKKKHKDAHYYPVINHSTVSKKLRDQLIETLNRLGFRNVYGSDRVQTTRTGTPVQVYETYISGKCELERWMLAIGSSNSRHKTKYEIWKKYGFCPPGTTLAQRVMILKGKLDPRIFY